MQHLLVLEEKISIKIRNVGPDQNNEIVFSVDRYDKDAVKRVLDLCSVADESLIDGFDFSSVGCAPDFSCQITFSDFYNSLDDGNNFFDAIEAIVDKKQKDKEKVQSARKRKPISEN